MVWDGSFEGGVGEWDTAELEEGSEDNERLGELPNSVDKGDMESKRGRGTWTVVKISTDENTGVGKDELGGEMTMTGEGQDIAGIKNLEKSEELFLENGNSVSTKRTRQKV